MAELLDYPGLYRLVADLVAQRRTATLFGKTDANRSVMIAVQRGEIVSLICAGKRGRSAIAALRSVNALSYRIEDTAAMAGGAETPPTAEILYALRPGVEPPAGATPAPTALAATQQGDGPRICQLLAEFVGPIAPVLCSEAIGAVGGLGGLTEREQVIYALAKEIDDQAEATHFIERAHRLLIGG